MGVEGPEALGKGVGVAQEDPEEVARAAVGVPPPAAAPPPPPPPPALLLLAEPLGEPGREAAGLPLGEALEELPAPPPLLAVAATGLSVAALEAVGPPSTLALASSGGDGVAGTEEEGKWGEVEGARGLALPPALLPLGVALSCPGGVGVPVGWAALPLAAALLPVPVPVGGKGEAVPHVLPVGEGVPPPPPPPPPPSAVALAALDAPAVALEPALVAVLSPLAAGVAVGEALEAERAGWGGEGVGEAVAGRPPVGVL